MKRKHRRLVFLGAGLGALGLAAGLVLSALDDTLVYFHDPSTIRERHFPPGPAACASAAWWRRTAWQGPTTG